MGVVGTLPVCVLCLIQSLTESSTAPCICSLIFHFVTPHSTPLLPYHWYAHCPLAVPVQRGGVVHCYSGSASASFASCVLTSCYANLVRSSLFLLAASTPQQHTPRPRKSTPPLHASSPSNSFWGLLVQSGLSWHAWHTHAVQCTPSQCAMGTVGK